LYRLLLVCCFVILFWSSSIFAIQFDNDTVIGFSWAPPKFSAVTHYLIYVSEDNSSFYLADITAEPYVEIPGQTGMTYSIKVIAVNAFGAGPESEASEPVICDTTAPTRPSIDDSYRRTGLDTVEIELLQPSYDDYLKTYQVKGGQYSEWTDTAETEFFRFKIDPRQEQILRVRAIDLAANAGAMDIVTVRVDSDGDGQADVDEMVCGTDFNDANAYFVMWTHRDQYSGNTLLEWNGSEGRVYQVFYSDNLDTWTLADIIVADADEMILWEDDGYLTGSIPSEVSRRFYRVCVANEFDSDLDGMSDFDEVIVGSDLNDSMSRFSLSVAKEPGTGHQILSWTGSSNRLYKIYYSDDLKNWDFADTVAIGSQSEISWEDDGSLTYPAPSTVDRRFYRLEISYRPDTA